MTHPDSPGRWPMIRGAAAAALLAVAILLPVEGVVDALAPRFNTVAGFKTDFIRGLRVLRIALAVNGLALVLLPKALKRMTFVPDAPLPWDRRDAGPAAALYLATALLAAAGLRESFQNDEWRCLDQYIRHGPLVIMSRTIADNHVLYSLLAWPFVAVLGTTEIAVRLPSFLLSPLGPPLLYLLLRREYPRHPSILAALPLAASPFFLSWVDDGRAYGILFPVILGLFLLQPGALEGSRRTWGLYIALGVAAVYLHIYASMAVVGLSAAGLLLPGGRSPSGRVRNLSALVLIGAISFLLYAPILPQYLDYSSKVRGDAMRGGVPSVFGEAFVLPLAPVWAVLFIGAAVPGFVQGRRPSPEGLAAVVTGTLQVALTELAASDHNARLYIPSLVFAWICLARTVAKAPPLQSGILAAALLAVTAAADVRYFRIGKRDFRGGYEEISRRRKPGETFAVIFDCRPMTAYAREPLPVLYPESLILRSPDWFTVIDLNLAVIPELEAHVRKNYEEVFRLPSVRGDLLGFRKKR